MLGSFGELGKIGILKSQVLADNNEATFFFFFFT